MMCDFVAKRAGAPRTPVPLTQRALWFAKQTLNFHGFERALSAPADTSSFPEVCIPPRPLCNCNCNCKMCFLVMEQALTDGLLSAGHEECFV